MRYFTLKEYKHSEKALEKNIKNQPSNYQNEKFEILRKAILEPVRDELGESITISSGYRCKALNKVVGGVWNSQHLALEDDIAVDLKCNDLEILYLLLMKYDFDQCIYEKKRNGVEWIHLSYKTKTENRNQFFNINK